MTRTARARPSRRRRLGETIDLDVQSGETIEWTQPDGAVVLAIVSRRSANTVCLRCHYDGWSWTRRHDLPLFASMVRRPFTTAEWLDTIE